MEELPRDPQVARMRMKKDSERASRFGNGSNERLKMTLIDIGR